MEIINMYACMNLKYTLAIFMIGLVVILIFITVKMLVIKISEKYLKKYFVHKKSKPVSIKDCAADVKR